MTEDKAESYIKSKQPGTLEWIKAMKYLINFESNEIKKLGNKLNKKDIDKEQLISLADSRDKNIQLLRIHW